MPHLLHPVRSVRKTSYFWQDFTDKCFCSSVKCHKYNSSLVETLLDFAWQQWQSCTLHSSLSLLCVCMFEGALYTKTSNDPCVLLKHNWHQRRAVTMKKKVLIAGSSNVPAPAPCQPCCKVLSSWIPLLPGLLTPRFYHEEVCLTPDSATA